MQGNWVPSVVDRAAQDVGVLQNWRLEIASAAVGEAPVMAEQRTGEAPPTRAIASLRRLQTPSPRDRRNHSFNLEVEGPVARVVRDGAWSPAKTIAREAAPQTAKKTTAVQAPPLLVSRPGSLVAFGRRCIPPRGVARRSNTLGILPPRALRVGRLAALDANKTSGTRH